MYTMRLALQGVVDITIKLTMPQKAELLLLIFLRELITDKQLTTYLKVLLLGVNKSKKICDKHSKTLSFMIKF